MYLIEIKLFFKMFVTAFTDIRTFTVELWCVSCPARLVRKWNFWQWQWIDLCTSHLALRCQSITGVCSVFYFVWSTDPRNVLWVICKWELPTARYAVWVPLALDGFRLKNITLNAVLWVGSNCAAFYTWVRRASAVAKTVLLPCMSFSNVVDWLSVIVIKL